MKIIKRNCTINVIRSFVSDEIQNGGNTYKIAIDNRNGNIVFIRRNTQCKYYNIIGSVDLSSLKPTKKSVLLKATEIHNVISAYNKTCYITYTRAVSEYGKKNVIDSAFVKEVENPYYKSASPMRLYDKNVLAYNSKAN
jgi:hypothetical protein